MQDDATGKIFYSLCNSNGSTPIFPANESAALTFEDDFTPKNGTSLTGIGYPAADGANTAAIWYQNEADQIVEATFNCDATGHFNASESWRIATEAQLNASTGLMAVNLGAEAGYRIYFHDVHLATSFLRYTQSDGWGVAGKVSQDVVHCPPIGAGLTDINKITVVMGRGPENIEVSTLQSNETWIVSLFPTPLNDVDRDDDEDRVDLPVTNNTEPQDISLNTNVTVNWALDAWDGNARGIGLTFDDDAIRSIFYIGTDKVLHRVTEDENGAWKASPGQDIDSWPHADEPNAQFASAFDFGRNEIYIYYMSGGSLTQIHQSGKNKWEHAVALSASNDTVIEGPSVNTGLSSGAKAGIGVGVSLGGIALLAFGAYIFLRRRKAKEEKKQAEAEAEAAAAAANQPPSAFGGSPAPAYTSGVMEGQWIDGQWIPSLPYTKPEEQRQDRYSYVPVPESQPVYHEMPNQEYTHEMPGENGRREVPNSHHELAGARGDVTNPEGGTNHTSSA